jgi:hypothetical protein
MTSQKSGRKDGDSWDLASGVGATATAVAASRAIAHRAALIDDPWAEPLVTAVGIEDFTAILAGNAPGDGSDVERMAHGMAVRTRYFDDFLIEATSAGIRQAVILASGLDSRAYRLAWPAGTMVFEVDQRRVIDFKVTTLSGLGAKPTAEVRNVGTDLREDWPAALRINGFDIHRLMNSTCVLPAYLQWGGMPAEARPYYVPIRALTHYESPNLLLAGKTMSMSFYANAVTRLHPSEWSTGSAAGAGAALMAHHGWDSVGLYHNVSALQALLSSDVVGQPLAWNLTT